jgi:hypothetical protein
MSPFLCLGRTKVSDQVIIRNKIIFYTFKRRVESHLPSTGIIRSSPYSPC